MIDIHESPYVAGEERLIKMSQDYIGKMSDVNYIKQQNEEKVARMQKSFADNGVN